MIKIGSIIAVGAGLCYLPYNWLTRSTEKNTTEVVVAQQPNHWELERKQTTFWVDSVYNALTEDERIGQLIMVRAHTDKGLEYENNVQRQIEQYKLGGVCFFQGTASRTAEVSNRYQNAARLPLFVAIDGEWGLSMRLKDTKGFPHQMTLGAIQDNNLIYEMGKEIGRQCRRIGVNVNFAPDIDINNNPRNPVIGDRSFGEDRINVAVKGYSYMLGMQEVGVMACGKHFPGHGDTDTDSHHDLPIINHSRQRLDTLEMFPFRALAQRGLMSIMAAHLSIPALDPTPNQPSTLSRPILTNILRNEIGFDGLIFTDAMEMQGVAKYYKNGEGEAKALIAGNDIVLMPPNIVSAMSAIKNAVTNGALDAFELEQKVKRVLRAKYELGLHRKPIVSTTNVLNEVNSAGAETLRRKLIEHSLTVVRNDDNLIPFTPNMPRIASLAIGAPTTTSFQRTLSNYAAVSHYNSGKEVSPSLLTSLKTKETVIVSLHGLSKKAQDSFGISASLVRFINDLAKQTKVLLVVFGSPYALKNFDGVNNVVAAYGDDTATQQLTAEGLFGNFEITGKLPITASPRSVAAKGLGFKATNSHLLRYGSPEEVGLNADTLAKIDMLADEIVRTGAAPGCQILIAKNNRVVFHRTYGYHTYQRIQAVDSSDIYDMASVTKIAATTISLMKLYEEGKFDPEGKLGDYLPELRGTNKANLRIKDVMSHQAGLKAWIPFYKETVVGGRPSPELYRRSPETGYTIPVADNLYMKDEYLKTMWKQIYDAPNANTGYVYSDLGFFIFAKIVKEQTGKSLDEFVQETFYQPMGLGNTTYKPLEKFDKSRIVPSENDTYWRQQVIQGHVHDMGAAMLGGVSGHAGLFSDAHGLAAILQMLCNGGSYGGKQYLQPETVRLFTSRVAGSNRRALGFDMRDLGSAKLDNIPFSAPNSAYGHTGFTGIGGFVDPENQIVYVFLSNRTFPTMDNKKLVSLDYRPKIMDIIYRAMK